MVLSSPPGRDRGQCPRRRGRRRHATVSLRRSPGLVGRPVFPDGRKRRHASFDRCPARRTLAQPISASTGSVPGGPRLYARRAAARTLIRASVPERVAILLTGHKSRAIFDRDTIIHEQELLDAGDQLVAYLAQQTQAAPGPGSGGGRTPPDCAPQLAPRPHGRVGPRSRHTWRRGGPTRPNTGTRQTVRYRPRVAGALRACLLPPPADLPGRPPPP